ncbi:ABC transporter, ATP-binding protein [Lachnospiraceae bacterium KM106-2]|nr:ABC transporter, ATP-binding protein [Lachnospiraceae bacterium KM106-2]
MIEVKNVTKEFVMPKKYPGLRGAIKGLFTNEKEVKRAVDDISFEIGDGEIVGYIGSNGAGKSTTIKMMTGILCPTHGQCLVDGIDPNKKRKENASNIGVVFGQRTQLWWDLPVSESFTILKEIYDVSKEDYEKRMEFLNEVLGLEEFFDHPVRTLSLGQRMRADLGAALLHNPKVLYLDEPTIGLDLVVKDKIRDAIKKMNETFHTTVILTTHDISDIEELCNRIIIIDHGRKIYDGTLEALKDNYGVRRKVIMEVKDPTAVKEFNMADALRVSEEDCRTEFEEKSNSYTITFHKHKIAIADIINQVMSLTDVNDVQIKETELADIVKAIYNHADMEVRV